MSDPSRRPPSLIILGTDALLAARPASPVQLAHACLALGYDGVVPASWGDELIADAAMSRLADHHDGPAVLCSCPHVARRMLQVGADLQPFLVSLVASPVAAARYLRALWSTVPIRLTFAGRCAGATDQSIDARIAPQELLAVIADRGISLIDQPQVFDEVIPPDRRRFHSLPGGAPAHARLRERCGRELIELRGRELAMELAQYLLTESDVVLDAAGALGCACSGASLCATPREAQLAIAAVEPPRAKAPVLGALPVAVQLDLPASAPEPAPVVVEVATPLAAVEPAPPSVSLAAAPPPADIPIEIVRYTRTGGVIAVTTTTTLSVQEETIEIERPREAGASLPRALSRRRGGQRPKHPRHLHQERRNEEEPPPPGFSAGNAVTVDPAHEMEQLRLTVARALEPFIAHVMASGALVEPDSNGPTRIAPPPLEPPPPDLRVTEVMAAIEIAREPDVVSREAETSREALPPVTPTAPAEMEAVIAGPVMSESVPPPTLKSIAATQRAAAGAMPNRRRDASPSLTHGDLVRRSRETGGVIPSTASRRRGRLFASITIITLVAVGAAVYLGLASRALHALVTLAR